ncbi:MAG: efflux RND transporter periplasmic adaptor subunit [Candidatus Binataceae bacterium]
MRSIKFLGLVIICAALLFGCERQADSPQPASPPIIPVSRPRRRTAIQSIALPGDLVGFYEATLYAKVTGYLKSISVDKGDRVKAGQVLAVIEVPELHSSLRRAKASLTIAKLTYQRLESVWKSDPQLIARQDVDIAYAKFMEAQASVSQLEAMVSYTRIVAPFSGVVTGRFVDPGALINAGSRTPGLPYSTGSTEGSMHPVGSATPVVSLARLDLMRLYVYVPQEDVALIHDGLPAKVTVLSMPGKIFKGTVTRYATALALSTRTMLTEIDLENPHDELYPGMYAEATLDLHIDRNALQLPDTAIGRAAKKSYIFVVRRGRLVKVPVQTGITSAHDVEITRGLTADDEVVNNLSPELVPGEKVTPRITPPLRWNNGESLAGLN